MQSPDLSVPGVRCRPEPKLSCWVPKRALLPGRVRSAPLVFWRVAGRPQIISASTLFQEQGRPIQVPRVRASTDAGGGGAVAEVGGKRGRVHFVGVGGAGISALALLALQQGFEVSGSDIVWSYSMDRLHKAGAKLYVGHSISNIYCNEGSNLPNAVVFSSAIPLDNAEVSYAKSIGIPVYKRGGWLGEITEQSTLVAVSGTHGKSTTTAMLSYVLHAMGKDITAVIGAEVQQLPERNIISGSGSLFVLEADEYDGCFLGVSPYVAVVTSLEWEHVDIFHDEEAVKNIFKRFLHQIRDGGYLILCRDSAGARALLDNSQQGSIFDAKRMSSSELTDPCYHVVTYGTSPVNEWHASSITPNKNGGQDYVLCHWKCPVAEISLQLPGLHNVLNSLAIIATITTLLDGHLPDIINQVKHHLSNFEGLSRRFEFVGKADHCFIFHDFAHHPTEVRMVLKAARQRFPFQEIWVVFQPHTFSRLSAMMKDFASAFSDANNVIVTEIYAARESNANNISGGDLAIMIDGPSSEYIPKMEEVLQKLIVMLSSRRSEETVVLVMGAGADDITKLGEMLLNSLQQTS